jgi:hypothetical protein
MFFTMLQMYFTVLQMYFAMLQMFFLDPSLHCAPNDEMVVDFEMRRKERNHRLMHVRMVHHVEGPSANAQYGAANKRTSVYSIE